TSVEEYTVRAGRDRAVRKLRDDACAHALDVLKSDAVLKRCGAEQVAFNFQNFVAPDGLRVRHALDRARLGLVPERRLHAYAVLVVYARARVGDCDDARA